MSVRAMPATETSLTLTVPAGWRIVQLDGLLGEWLPDAMITALGDDLEPGEAAALRDEFRSLRAQVSADRVVFAALREGRQRGAHDVMTIALPGADQPPGDGAGGGAAVDERQAQLAEAVSLGDVNGLMHRSPPSGAAGSWVQLVRFLPGTRRGAILTLLSSQPDREEDLAGEAIEVARSLGMASGPDRES